MASQLLNVNRWTQAAIALVHLWREGRRWQMIPSYFSLLIPAQYRYLKAALASVSGLLSLALPVFKLPPLKGPYSISHKDFEWVEYVFLDRFSHL